MTYSCPQRLEIAIIRLEYGGRIRFPPALRRSNSIARDKSRIAVATDEIEGRLPIENLLGVGRKRLVVGAQQVNMPIRT